MQPLSIIAVGLLLVRATGRRNINTSLRHKPVANHEKRLRLDLLGIVIYTLFGCRCRLSGRLTRSGEPLTARHGDKLYEESCYRFHRRLSITSLTTLDSRWNAAESQRQRLPGSFLRQSSLIWFDQGGWSTSREWNSRNRERSTYCESS